MDLKEAATLATRHSGLCCPRCGSYTIRKNGTCRTIQRYLCKQCRRCFNETVNTPLHGIHNKQKMLDYITTMTHRASIRRAAADIGISTCTAFSWRHKLLSSFTGDSVQIARSPAALSTISLPYSFKGRRSKPDKPYPRTRTILVSDAISIPSLVMLPLRCTAMYAATILRAAIPAQLPISVSGGGILPRAAILSGRHTIQHPQQTAQLSQRASASADTICRWMHPFHGVATKYLQQYWNWYKHSSDTQFMQCCLSQRQLHTYRRLRNSSTFCSTATPYPFT